MNCKNCGEVVPATGRFCDACGTPVEASEAAGQPSAAGPPVAEAPWPSGRVSWPSASVLANPAEPAVAGVAATAAASRLPDSPIVMADGENVLKSYKAVRLRSTKRGEGTLYVTDARIVFYARAQGRGAQRASAIVQQTRLEDITGLSAFVSRRVSPVILLLATLFGLATLGSLIARDWTGVIVALLLTALCVAAYSAGWAERGRAGVTINSSATQVSPITFGTFTTYRNPVEVLLSALLSPLGILLRAHSAFDVLVGRPGADSDQLISELGALILDLQTRGMLSAEHWGVAVVPAQRRATS
jgi:hypothetical protein